MCIFLQHIYSNFYNVAIFIFGDLSVGSAQIFHQSCVTLASVCILSGRITSNSHHRSNVIKREVVLSSPIFSKILHSFTYSSLSTLDFMFYNSFRSIFTNIDIYTMLTVRRYVAIDCNGRVVRDIVSFRSDRTLTNINCTGRRWAWKRSLSLHSLFLPLSL